MIDVQNLTKYFGPVLAIDRVTFQVDKREVVGFLGLNGAGKSTTMRILTSYLPATTGVARVAGYDVMTQSMEVRRSIGYLPENVPLYPEMRVAEYLDYRARLKGIGRAERPKRIEYCLERCRLREVRRRLLGTLSKGYRQRVGLADAIVHDPPILILDEPTSGLDPVQIRETLAFIKEISENHTILLSSHILPEVEEICERVVIITAGRVSRRIDDLDAESALIMEVRGPVEAVTKTISAVDGVTGVTTRAGEKGVTIYEIRMEGNRDVREPLAKAMMHNGWLVLRLERQRRKLEDAFFDVLRAQDPLKEAIKN